VINGVNITYLPGWILRPHQEVEFKLVLQKASKVIKNSLYIWLKGIAREKQENWSIHWVVSIFMTIWREGEDDLDVLVE